MAAIASTPSPTWITPKQAAEALGVSERSVYNLCEASKLGYEVQRVKGRKPFRMVNAADVERMIGSQVRAVVVTAVPAPAPMSRIGETAVGPHVAPDAAAFQHFLAGVLQAFPIHRAWLTLDEAAAFSGLPKSWLLAQARHPGPGHSFAPPRCIEAINVGTEKRASWRFSRAALAR